MHPELRFSTGWLSVADATGHAVPAKVLIDAFRGADWRSMVLALAHVAANLANDPGGGVNAPVQERLRLAALDSRMHRDGLTRAIASYVAARPGRPIGHEAVVYFCQALAILYGNESGHPVSENALALLLLVANDHVPDPYVATTALSREDRHAASTLYNSQWNQSPDPVLSVIRGATLLDEPPRRGAIRTKEEWSALQRAAFQGLLVEEYVEALAGPLVFRSFQWGRPDGEVPPIVTPSNFITSTAVDETLAAPFYASLSADRAWYDSRFRKRLRDGLPSDLSAFSERPLIRTGPDQLVAASHWAVREHMRMGFWHRMFGAAKEIYGSGSGASRWPFTFGFAFEAWCQRVIRWEYDVFAREQRFAGTGFHRGL